VSAPFRSLVWSLLTEIPLCHGVKKYSGSKRRTRPCDPSNPWAIDACTDGASLLPLWTDPHALIHHHALSLYPRRE
jgi:hypothetical protein